MNVFAVGASRNIGYYAATRLLASGATVTFLMRSPSVFDKDEKVQRFISSGKAHIAQGDALKKEDMSKAWNKALEVGNGSVDLILFTVGGIPTFKFSKGFVIEPTNLCTQSLFNLLTTLPSTTALPKLVAVSSNGLTKSSHAALPLVLKPLYSFLLEGPHADKLGVERLIAHCVGREWTEDEIKSPNILPTSWQDAQGLPKPGSLRAVVVCPSLLTDGECKGETSKKAYRAGDGNLNGAYYVSRKDVGHFITEVVLPNWDQWEGKYATITY